jgi:hypothetical protein
MATPNGYLQVLLKRERRQELEDLRSKRYADMAPKDVLDLVVVAGILALAVNEIPQKKGVVTVVLPPSAAVPSGQPAVSVLQGTNVMGLVRPPTAPPAQVAQGKAEAPLEQAADGRPVVERKGRKVVMDLGVASVASGSAPAPTPGAGGGPGQEAAA